MRYLDIMKSTIKASFLIFTAFFLFSFTQNSVLDYVGTYGVTDNDPSQIELVLNKDFTFTYTDLSSSSRPIKAKGKWILKNKRVYLLNRTDFVFHTKWKFSKDGKTAKSRKGLTYYSLAKK